MCDSYFHLVFGRSRVFWLLMPLYAAVDASLFGVRVSLIGLFEFGPVIWLSCLR
jgi:hypothetical protein